jgi:UDP-glucuronate 4-epimerase
MENGIRVTMIDRFSDYYSRELKVLRAQDLQVSFGQATLNIDLAKAQEIQQLGQNQFTHIIHLAGQPGVRVTEANQLTYLNDNVTGFANIMDFAVRFKVPNFIYASSSSVYQNARTLPFNEVEILEIPTNFYARTKYLDEKIAESFSGSIPNLCGLRFFSVYGPWGRPDMAYFKLFQSAYSGSAFPLNGTGEISRDFTFVDDVTKAIGTLINSENPYPRILNVGGGNVNKMNDVILTIQEISGRKINISPMPANPQDLQTTRADTTLQQEALGIYPVTTLHSGITAIDSWITSLNSIQDFLNWR